MGVALYAVVGGLALGWLSTLMVRGGRGDRGSLGIEDLWIVPVALSVQIVWERWWSSAPDSPAALRLAVPISTAALLIMAARNRRWPAARLVGVGIALNLAVMVANGNLMPVSERDAAASMASVRAADLREGWPLPGSKDVVVDPARTHLQALSDHLAFSLPYGPQRIVSPGDVLMMVGIAWWLAHVTRVALLQHKGSPWLRTRERAGSSSSPAITA